MRVDAAEESIWDLFWLAALGFGSVSQLAFSVSDVCLLNVMHLSGFVRFGVPHVYVGASVLDVYWIGTAYLVMLEFLIQVL